MARLDEADLLRLVDGIYEAALDRARWPAVLDYLSGLYDGKAILFQQDLACGKSAVLEFCGFEPDYVRSYVEHYGALNPCLERRARLPAGSVATDVMLIERPIGARSEFYNDWLRPQGLGAAIGAVLEKGAEISVNVAVLRASRRGLITPTEYSFFERVAPHLRRALRLDRELTAANIGRDLGLDVLDRLGSAVFIVDGDARLSYASHGAEDILRGPLAANGLGIHHGSLCGPTPAETHALTAAVRASVRNGNATSAAPPPVDLHFHRPDAAPLSVLITPLKSSGPFALGQPTAMVLVHAPEDRPSFDAARLARFFGLTLACGRLLAGLLGGQSLAEYAEASGVSLNTVKTQLQKLFLDTGHARQSDLVRMVLSDPVAVATARVDRHLL